jgi:hypothetical protein
VFSTFDVASSDAKAHPETSRDLKVGNEPHTRATREQSTSQPKAAIENRRALRSVKQIRSENDMNHRSIRANKLRRIKQLSRTMTDDPTQREQDATTLTDALKSTQQTRAAISGTLH